MERAISSRAERQPFQVTHSCIQFHCVFSLKLCQASGVGSYRLHFVKVHLWANDADTGLCSSLLSQLSQMNTHKLELIAKAQHLCLLLLLCLCLALGGVPGPCRHSITQDHLLNLNRLIDNQLDHGCIIIYPFIEHLDLSKVCYIKAAFPQILELLSMHFHYARNSDNRRYVNILEKVIYNLYSQGCIPEVNEEFEDSPVRFISMVESSPKEALKKARGVIQMYMSLMTESTGPVDWDCQAEYAAEEDSESTTVADTSTRDSAVLFC